MTGPVTPWGGTRWWLTDNVLKAVPWEHRWALERRASRNRPMWALMSLMCGAMIGLAIAAFLFDRLLGLRIGGWPTAIGLLVLTLAVTRLAARRRWVTLRREVERLPCWECGYSLRGLDGDWPRCPECGTPFDPAVYERSAEAIRREKGEPSPAE